MNGGQGRTSGAANLRERMLELSRSPETGERMANAILSGLNDIKIKPGDAIKLYEFLASIQAEDAANAPDLEGLDLSAYSDEELRAMLVRLADGGAELPEVSAPVPPPAGGGLSADRRRAETPPNRIRIQLEDFL